MMASSVAETSGRPFHLGIGAGGHAIVERWNGLAYRQTVDRVRDFIAIVRTALAGQRTDYTGTVLSSHGFALVRPPAVPIPIYVGAIGERMIDLATETADGLILSWASPRMAAAELASARGLVGAHGRDPAAFRVVGRMYGCVTTDVDGTREMVRQELVAYLASPPYGRYFARHGFEVEVDAVKRAFADGDRRRCAAAVSDRMLDELLNIGSEAQIREKAEAYWAAGVDDLMVQVVPVGGPATAEATIRAVL
jgi:alkanesulfonate monooxygenase SsuD/methylene tetrahydromethanopterin reductase-like flavin-dependent oxidoreductase (luciferase family)